MFGQPPITERKPSPDWRFSDNKITGIVASHGTFAVILPYGLTDEQRDLMLWAFDAGAAQGHHEGVRFVRVQIKSALGIT